MNATQRLVFPLDVPTPDEARTLVRRLAGVVGMFKVGLELFVAAGPDVVRMIREESGAGIFLDLKLHDIPATVGRAVERMATMGVDFTTVHCGEGPSMLRAAVAAAEDRVGILGVTVLTSVSAGDLADAGFQGDLAAPNRMVDLRAAQAFTAGCAGVVCSGKECGGVKARFGQNFVTMVPGIRPDWDGVSAQDQRRVTTPGAAIAAGADYLVVGRPIRDAADPVDAAKRIVAEIADALEKRLPNGKA